MKVLVASLRHHLLPLAHRLRREGHDVEVVVWRSRFESAWDGSFRKLVRHSDGSLNADAFSETVAAAQRGEVAVVTDVHRVAELFRAAPLLFANPTGLADLPQPVDRLMFGGWFTGEAIVGGHLLVADHGAWTGGLGAPLLGGVTLVRLSVGGDLAELAFVGGAARRVQERLKQAGFRGLFHFDLEENLASGELELRGLAAGWPWLATQAWLAELESLGDVLCGAEPRPRLTRRFVTVLPVTVPPWPFGGNEKREPVEVAGLTVQQQGACFWYDMRVEGRRLMSAGLDGLLCVATGASDSTPALARARALELATRLQVPGKQFRADAGVLVDGALATLEDRYGFSAL